MELIKETKEVTKTITETQEVTTGLKLDAKEARILAAICNSPEPLKEWLLKSSNHRWRNWGITEEALKRFIYDTPVITHIPAETTPDPKRIPKVGDKVRIVRKVTEQEGWDNSWIQDMDWFVGHDVAYKVYAVSPNGYRLDGIRYSWPSDALEVISD